MSHFWIPFISVALAELGDKTQLAVMLLASRTQDKTKLFFGVLLAFFLVDGAAILAGAWIRDRIPVFFISLISGILFLIFGILTLRHQGESEKTESPKMKSVFWLGFTMIAIAEWGDKTQMASGVFASQFHPMAVLAGTMGALTLLSGLSIAAGSWISQKIPAKTLHQIAGILFLILGGVFIFSALTQFGPH